MNLSTYDVTYRINDDSTKATMTVLAVGPFAAEAAVESMLNQMIASGLVTFTGFEILGAAWMHD